MKYLVLPPLSIDVLLNFLLCVVGAVLALDPSMIDGSWDQSLSARAGHEQEKKHPYFGRVACLIDAVFGDGHCKAQWAREQEFGGVWAAWSAQ